jgi:hypothetical protein
MLATSPPYGKQPCYALSFRGALMARLHAYGGDNGTKALSELDSVDLKAVALSHAWGVSGYAVLRIPPSPCTREECGGSVLIWDGERRCILCARPGGVDPVPMTRVNGHSPRRYASGAL